VIVGVGQVFELSGHEGVGIFGDEIFGAIDGALHAVGVGGADDFGTERLHDDDFLLREIFGDEKTDFVSLVDADEGETYAGVACGGFDDGATGLEFSFLFGTFDDADGGAVFDAAPGIQVLKLGEYIG